MTKANNQDPAERLLALLPVGRNAMDQKPPKPILQAVAASLVVTEFEDVFQEPAFATLNEDVLYLDITARRFMLRVIATLGSMSVKIPDAAKEADAVRELASRAIASEHIPLVALVSLELQHRPPVGTICAAGPRQVTMELSFHGFGRSVAVFDTDRWLELLGTDVIGSEVDGVGKGPKRARKADSIMTVSADFGRSVASLISSSGG